MDKWTNGRNERQRHFLSCSLQLTLSYKIRVPLLCVLNVGAVPMVCILNDWTVPTLCILNVGTIPTFRHFLILFSPPGRGGLILSQVLASTMSSNLRGGSTPLGTVLFEEHLTGILQLYEIQLIKINLQTNYLLLL